MGRTYWTRFSAFALVLVLALAGCNTMEGAGEDVEDAGEATQDAAD
ncbi:entericidin A/B family lipoprotein [Thiohalorhabdus denitrificans]|uniref:Predicted small secreted protein n=1 Tax=Thiohalorhabdus denitrificans TaxID=381306 RepID=A0A1G5G693_9GAMM|nr:entericidin A/B family lipoprotein [Thiohalorhabdus denitrificans]SCY47082.1 Predicted small secreted protein [Thiohalorhabdus denitrificans]